MITMQVTYRVADDRCPQFRACMLAILAIAHQAHEINVLVQNGETVTDITDMVVKAVSDVGSVNHD